MYIQNQNLLQIVEIVVFAVQILFEYFSKTVWLIDLE